MPEKRKEVRKKRRVEITQTPDEEDVELVEREGEQVLRKKTKRRRSQQKKELKLQRMEQRFFWATLVLVSFVFFLVGGYGLRFLHVNGPEFEQKFVAEAEGALQAQLEVHGLAFSPQAWSFGKLTFKAENQVIKKLELSKGRVSDLGYGILGLAWRGEEVGVEKALVSLDFEAPDLFVFDQERLNANYRFFRAHELTILAANSGKEIVSGATLSMSSEKLMLDDGTMSFPHFGRIPLNGLTMQENKGKWGVTLLVELGQTKYRLNGTTSKRGLELEGEELSLPLSQLDNPILLWDQGQLQIPYTELSGAFDQLQFSGPFDMTQSEVKHEGIIQAVHSLGLDKSLASKGMLDISGHIVFDSEGWRITKLEIISEFGFRVLIDEYHPNKHVTLRLYFPNEWIGLTANSDLVKLSKTDGIGRYLSFETWFDGETWKDDLDLRIHSNRTKVGNENEKNSLEQQLEKLLPSSP